MLLGRVVTISFVRNQTKMSSVSIISDIAFLEAGLVPPSVDLDKALSEMTDEEARKTKRRFRKQYRKILKKFKRQERERLARKEWTGRTNMSHRRSIVDKRLAELDSAFGCSHEKPSAIQMRNRKTVVKTQIRRGFLKNEER